MNNKKELYIEAGSHFLYVETDCNTIDEALDQFCDKLNAIGCVADNFFHGTKMELREWNDAGDYKVVESKSIK